MKRTALLLRIAGGLTLFTCLGHTAGTFMKIPAEQTEVAKAAAVMKATPVPMPIGKAQSYADLFLGTNLVVSLYLLTAGLGFFFLSGAGALAGVGRKLLLLNSLGVGGIAVTSALFFFPLPAACTGIAALLGVIAVSKSS